MPIAHLFTTGGAGFTMPYNVPERSFEQGLQYGTIRSELAYYVPRTLHRTVPAYRTSVQFLKSSVAVPLQQRHTVPAYRTSWRKLRHIVQYLRTVPHCHPCF